MRGSSQPRTSPSFTIRRRIALAQHGVGQSKRAELDLLRAVDAQLVAEPLVQRPMILVVQVAQRVGDALDRVALPVRPVVHRIDAPLVAGAVMLGVQDAVHDRVAHVEVRVRHVDLGAQRARCRRGTRPSSCARTGRGSPRTERSRQGLFLPGSVRVPRYSRTSSGDRSQTYALPLRIRSCAHS